ncbi:MAG: hypothetical protein IAI49_12090, partial [Candidatus Eremiobacteraeota bacterium]|nr:hypothetical protein [Candidatus Eremiobacteraeota bacterium]
MKVRRPVLVGLGIALLVVLAVVIFIGPLLRAGIGYGGRLAGYGVRYGDLTNRDGHLTMTSPDVSSARGEPLFTAERIDVAYDLRRVWRSPYLYGISAIEIDRPKITIVHHKDGSYNFTLPASNAKQSNAAPAIPKIRLVVKDGSLGIIDATRIFAHSRHLAIRNLQLDADVDPK